MGWFTSSPSSSPTSSRVTADVSRSESSAPPTYAESIAASTTATPGLTSTTATSKDNATACPPKPKPCCVCKDEKAARDECMLFSRADDPQEDCKGMVMRYRECMAGFGFKI